MGLRQQHMMLNSPTGRIEWLQVTRFFVRRKQFVITLPDWWQPILDRKEVAGKTLDEVDAAFNQAMREYEERTTSLRKVIVFKFRVSLTIYKYDAEGHVESCLFKKTDVSFTDGTALDFWWDVGFESASLLNPQKKYTDLDGNSMNKSGMKVMEWTAEREAFFNDLQSSLEQLIVKADTFFSLNMADILHMISQYGSINALPNLSAHRKESHG